MRAPLSRVVAVRTTTTTPKQAGTSLSPLTWSTPTISCIIWSQHSFACALHHVKPSASTPLNEATRARKPTFRASTASPMK